MNPSIHESKNNYTGDAGRREYGRGRQIKIVERKLCQYV
jgi:hypothetical protein